MRAGKPCLVDRRQLAGAGAVRLLRSLPFRCLLLRWLPLRLCRFAVVRLLPAFLVLRSRFLVAASGVLDGTRVPEKLLMDWLKEELRRSYRDVSTIKRA